MYKILIADDEALMRKGLCTLIDWAKLGCQIVGTAENGLQAKQAVLDYQPDIIIADIKMPVMDGLELARWVCGAQRQIQIILLTAFADFSYAQQAIQYGVSDYVTKTGNMNDIVAAVERCKQKLDQQRLLHVDVGSRISSMLSAVLSGTLHHEAEIRQQAAALGLTASGYAVAVADLRSAEAMNPSPMLRAGLEKLFYSLLPPEQLYLCPQGRHELYMVFPDCSDTQLRSFCFDCVSTARKLLGKTLYLGVSENSRPLCELQDALAQAHRALQDRFYDQQEVHFFRHVQTQRAPTYAAYFTTLGNALKSADLPQAETALAHFFDTQRRQHAPEAQVKETAMMVMHTCRSTLEAFGADLDAVDLDRAEWKRQLQQMQFHQDCIRHQKQLVRAVCQYLALLSTEGGNLLADVQNYMDMHFCEALTLSELAAAVHVSPGYLSRFFRQKTGRTVMETIAGKKIEYARQLLDEGNLKVFEVAQRVGFEDTTYFSHVFKKYTGMSAKEYLTQAQRRKRAAAEKTT